MKNRLDREYTLLSLPLLHMFLGNKELELSLHRLKMYQQELESDMMYRVGSNDQESMIHFLEVKKIQLRKSNPHCIFEQNIFLLAGLATNLYLYYLRRHRGKIRQMGMVLD